MKWKVVHIITRLILGGAQENTLLTVEGLMRRPEYDVALITGPALGPEGELEERARRNGVNLIIVPEMRRELHPWRDCRTLCRLVALIRQMRPHIVHTHSSKAGILGRLAARIASAPVVVHTIHGPSFHPYLSPAENQAYVLVERVAAHWTTRLISVADAMTEQFLAAGVGRRELFQTIYSGMEVGAFLTPSAPRAEVRRRLGIQPDDVVIGKVARLFELKGHEYVILAAPRVLAKFPRVRFLFVGDGILRDELRALARDVGVEDKVVFAGLVDPACIPEMIHAMDVVVHASLREGLARVLPQAFLCGKPVISYDVDGAKEVVLDGKTGYLVPPESVDELAEAIVKTLSNPVRAREMAEAGRALVIERFDADTMVAQIDALYKRLLARRWSVVDG